MNWRILKNKNSPGETLFHMNFAGRKRNFGNKNTKALLAVLFLVIGILFFGSNDAKAVEASCEGLNLSDTTNSSGVFSDGKSLCTCQKAYDAGKCVGLKASTQEECKNFSNQKDSNNKQLYSLCKFQGNGNPNSPNGGGTSTIRSDLNPTGTGVQRIVADMTDNIFVTGIKWILAKVLELVGWLFAIAATLFAWVVDPANVSGPNGMLNKQAVKDVWIMVRDLLNMGFILVLLFAAFGTIFQVDSLNLKKVWLNILINALLVNFSYPIARFIIDISNVAFYYFLNNLFSPNGETAVSGSSIFAGFGNSSNLAGMLVPTDYTNHDIAYLIASIVVVFILGMTLMIIAGLFVIRLVALTMLVMFSPIGFVGFILPSTKSYANKWWKNLLNYSFFAPIMIFGMAISLRILEAMKNENFKSFISNANVNATKDQSDFIAAAAFYFIPIIILWATIGIAKSSGIEFADKVTGSVKKWGKKIANSPLGLGKYAWKQTGIPGGVKKGWENSRKSGKIFGIENGLTRFALKNERESRESLIAGGFGNRGKGWNNAKIEMERTQANDQRKKWKEQGGATDADLQSALVGNNAAKAKAAALELAEKNGIKNLKQYQAAAAVVENDAVFKDLFKSKSKEKHIKYVIDSDIQNSEKKMSDRFGRPLTVFEQKRIRDAAYEKHLGGMTGDALSKQKKLLSTDEFHDSFMSKRMAGGSKEDKAFIAKTASKMSPSDRRNWKGRGYSV